MEILMCRTKIYYVQILTNTCCIMISDSMKERGNGFFRKMNYKEAIKCYEEYVQQPHPDNKNAYSNLSLCYSKLAQHNESIQAARKAIELDPTFTKPYYRLVQTYRDLTGHPYEVLVNAVQYYRLASEQEDREKEEMFAIIRHFRTLLKSKSSSSKKSREDESFRTFQQLRQKNKSGEELNNFLDKYLQEWTEEWNSNVQSDDAKWEEIAYIMRYEDYNYGINLAYFYLNRTADAEKKQQIKDSILQIKQQMNKKTKIPACEDFEEGEVNVAQVESGSHTLSEEQRNREKERMKRKIMKSKKEAKAREEKKAATNAQAKPFSKKDMLMIKQTQKQQFGDSEEEEEEEEEEEREMEIEEPTPPQPSIKVRTLKPATQTKQPPKQSSQQPTTIEKTNQKAIQKTKQKTDPSPPPPPPSPLSATNPDQTSPTKPMASPTPQAPQTVDQTQQLYTKYCSNLSKAKNLMKETFISIESILNDAKLPLPSKQSLLVLLKKKQPKLKMIVSAFTNNEKQVIYNHLLLNKIEEYAADYVPDLYKK